MVFVNRKCYQSATLKAMKTYTHTQDRMTRKRKRNKNRVVIQCNISFDVFMRCFVSIQIWLVLLRLLLFCCCSEKVPRLQYEIDFAVCLLFFFSLHIYHTYYKNYKIVQWKKVISHTLLLLHTHLPSTTCSFEFIVLSSFVLHILQHC